MISHRITASALAICISASALTAHHFYGPYPVTLKGYDGDKTNSVSYGGQIARQAMEQSLKKLSIILFTKKILLFSINNNRNF